MAHHDHNEAGRTNELHDGAYIPVAHQMHTRGAERTGNRDTDPEQHRAMRAHSSGTLPV
ncbi:MAG: hypothetical protein ACREEL_08970 [Stellaceae bacterium]